MRYNLKAKNAMAAKTMAPPTPTTTPMTVLRVCEGMPVWPELCALARSGVDVETCSVVYVVCTPSGLVEVTIDVTVENVVLTDSVLLDVEDLVSGGGGVDERLGTGVGVGVGDGVLLGVCDGSGFDDVGVIMTDDDVGIVLAVKGGLVVGIGEVVGDVFVACPVGSPVFCLFTTSCATWVRKTGSIRMACAAANVDSATTSTFRACVANMAPQIVYVTEQNVFRISKAGLEVFGDCRQISISGRTRRFCAAWSKRGNVAESVIKGRINPLSGL